MNEVIKKQEKKILAINKRFDEFEINVNRRFDELLEQAIKPPFTPKEIFWVLSIVLTWSVSIMLYATNTKSNTRNNETRIENLEDSRAREIEHYETFQNTLSKIQSDVSYIKGKEDGKAEKGN